MALWGSENGAVPVNYKHYTGRQIGYRYWGEEIGPWGSCVPWLTAGFRSVVKRPGAAGQVDSKAL
eukprot:2653012-Prymnesium_polylepis.1